MIYMCVCSNKQEDTIMEHTAQFCARVWRRAAIAAAAASRSRLAWTISWLGFGLFDQLLLVRYPWGKVCYPLFGYLA
jgi:hypothetical protein